jgi:hypothetical protein
MVYGCCSCGSCGARVAWYGRWDRRSLGRGRGIGLERGEKLFARVCDYLDRARVYSRGRSLNESRDLGHGDGDLSRACL